MKSQNIELKENIRKASQKEVSIVCVQKTIMASDFHT
jgi:hypothetical protein